MSESVIPCGSWASPIDADTIVAAGIGFGTMQVAAGGDLFWVESRPQEGGRNVLVHHSRQGWRRDLTAPELNARTRAHEYGGGDFAIGLDEVFFSNFADQRLYHQALDGGPARPLTPPAPCCFADALYDPGRHRLLAVREDHRQPDREPANTLVAIDLTTPDLGQVLAEGHDFFSSPRLSPDGQRLAWLSWDHPNMPWDGSELWVAEFDRHGRLHDPTLVAGGRAESIWQPEWGPDGSLYFASDHSGWWNLQRWRNGQTVTLLPLAAEFGRAQWGFGMSSYAVVSNDLLVCAYSRNGRDYLAQLDPHSGELEVLVLPYTCFAQVRATPDCVYFQGAGPDRPAAIVALHLDDGQCHELSVAGTPACTATEFSRPESIVFPGSNGQPTHAFYYPPHNPRYRVPPGELPPLLVRSHGGPTAAASTALNLKLQFWTSRGFAVVDVNYGGSTGFGRAYRERLHGTWGLVDVEDCAAAARFLAETGRADPRRLAITGGSAGGYTTLCALTFTTVFRAGASYYGVSDLEALARDTHKFESRYLDRLVGPYPARRDLYRERSPLYHCERLSCPVIFFQGLEDRVVPPNQAEAMVEALRRKGVAAEYVTYPGEQHGFRQAANIRHAVRTELAFYAKVFGFTPAPEVDAG